MIIDVHVHPQFTEPQQGNTPSQLNINKLDIVANPQHFPIALGQTSHYYYQRNHIMLPLPEFINQMDEAKIDKIVLVNPAIKGMPVNPMNESARARANGKKKRQNRSILRQVTKTFYGSAFVVRKPDINYL